LSFPLLVGGFWRVSESLHSPEHTSKPAWHRDFAAPRFLLSIGHLAALTERIVLSTAVTLGTTNDPVKIAEGYAMLQHLAKGRLDLMLGRGNTAPVYPWFGQDISKGPPLARGRPSRPRVC
jgi:alkanesulfonate monooxygenase SsuD/methylene tetrahydromethanopterin reductase-like flavin-dependent oxidoreductase (luciferase family)